LYHDFRNIYGLPQLLMLHSTSSAIVYITNPDYKTQSWKLAQKLCKRMNRCMKAVRMSDFNSEQPPCMWI